MPGTELGTKIVLCVTTHSYMVVDSGIVPTVR